MSDKLGSLAIVLHGHLPYVLHHGSYPHGENWLFEAAAETYLPLLDTIGECALHNARPALTVGLTPVLLEQLAHKRFKEGFVAYLNERRERAGRDRAEFEKSNEMHMAHLADRWQDWYSARLEHFERIKRDIPAEFARRAGEGHIEILTSNATHAYMPLLLNDQAIHAQMAAGTAVSRQRLGFQPRGMWLPECAYRPQWDHWLPSVLFDNPRSRPGLELFIANAGLTHFFIDSKLIADGNPVGTVDHGQFHEISPAQLYWDTRRGWRSPMEAVGVVSYPQPPKVVAFARHPKVSEQVWSSKIGYPGSGVYLEFHRKHGERGLRYHKVTDNKIDLSGKQLYYPDDVPSIVFQQAQHFCNVVRGALQEHRDQTGRQGVVIAPFDAELFGHWWFEGLRFLRDVVLTLANDSSVDLITSQEALERHRPDKVMRLSEGSWGEKNNHSVWINDRNRWMWEIEYRAENDMLRLLHALPWRTNSAIADVMVHAGRQLLLLQASDWPFVVHSFGAVDYGIQRFAGHSTNFNRCCDIAEHLAGGGELTPLHKLELEHMDAHDSIFANIDLNWWM